MDAQNDRHPGHPAGIPADDDLFAAFGSEHELPPEPRRRRRDGSSGLDLEDLALWSHENPLSLFASEEASPSVPMVADVRPTAPVPPQSAVTSSRARARWRVAVTPVALSAMALVAMLGAAAVVTMLVSGRQEMRVAASVPVAAATTPPVATPVLGAAEPPIATDEPLAEPIKPASDSGNDSPTTPRAPVNAVAADALPATNVARRPAPVTVPATTTVPATSQPPASTVAAAPAALALDPGETLPAVNARPVSPDVASTGGVVAPPRVVATAGTLPAAAAPAAVPVAAAVTAPPATGAASAAAETAAIESVLSRYAAAFTARDVVAAKSVWPRVNERGLLKAFGSVEEQQFDLGACVITANVAQAVALCDGTARYVPKVGSKRMRSEARRWTFRLGQRDGDWSIETVEFR